MRGDTRRPLTLVLAVDVALNLGSSFIPMHLIGAIHGLWPPPAHNGFPGLGRVGPCRRELWKGYHNPDNVISHNEHALPYNVASSVDMWQGSDLDSHVVVVHPEGVFWGGPEDAIAHVEIAYTMATQNREQTVNSIRSCTYHILHKVVHISHSAQSRAHITFCTKSCTYHILHRVVHISHSAQSRAHITFCTKSCT